MVWLSSVAGEWQELWSCVSYTSVFKLLIKNNFPIWYGNIMQRLGRGNTQKSVADPGNCSVVFKGPVPSQVKRKCNISN